MTRWTQGGGFFGLLVLMTAIFAPTTRADGVTEARLLGAASVAGRDRAAVLRLTCAMDGKVINNLALSFELTKAESLKPLFDVAPFEGPDGKGAVSRLVATGANGTAELGFGANGSFIDNGSFSFDAAFTPGPDAATGLKPARALVGALAAGPGSLVWRVANAKKGGDELVVTVVVTELDAPRIALAMAGCLRG